MKLKPLFVFLCTSLAAISTSASSATCDDLAQSEQTLNQTSIQLYDIETKVVKASNDGTPLPEYLVAPDTRDREAALRNLNSAFQRLRTTLRALDDQGSGKHSASFEKLDEQLQSFQAKLSLPKGDQKVSHDASTQASGQGTMTYGKLLRSIRAIQKLSNNVNKVLAAAIKKRCSSQNLEARQDGLSDLLTAVTDALGDIPSSISDLLDTLGDLPTTILGSLGEILFGLEISVIGNLVEVLSSILA